MHRLKNDRDKIYIFADVKDSSFPVRIWLKHIFLLKLEIIAWLLINKINPRKVKIFYKDEIVNNKEVTSNDVLLSFSFRNLDRDYPGSMYWRKMKPNKLFHLTHYLLDTSKISDNAEKYGIKYFVAENNLAKNSRFFQKFFPSCRNVYTLPFVFQERFKAKKSFSERENKCLATGTYQILTKKEGRVEDFMNFFGVDTPHPMRKEIYENRESIKNIIDSYISDFHEVKPKEVSSIDNAFLRIIKSLYNLWFVKQSKYFKFDIVEKYNEYKMFIVPEEANDLPGIGFVEGMACGCAYFGIVDPMYSDIGLIDGIHYIGYDGTLDSLIDKIEYYQLHQDELELIAHTGMDFVRKNFNGKIVADKFLEDMECFSKNRSSESNRNDIIQSSFTVS